MLRWANRIAAALGMLRPPRSAAELVEAAQRRTGLDDFGDSRFEEALEILLKSYKEEADLSAFGRMAAEWDALRCLSNLLVLREAEKRDPAIVDQPIVAPIFVTGLPRSGTTFLHNLLSLDASNRVVRAWETIYPSPMPHGHARADDRPRRKVDRQLAAFARLAPEFRSVHPLSADSPQECTEVTSQVFASLRFDTTHRVPSYRDWFDKTDQTGAYRFHRRFLRYLQRQKGRGVWVLKCPDHVFALKAIRAVYPDARFVFLHRDPVEVLGSVAKLTEVLRRPFTRRINRHEIGRQVSERWLAGGSLLVEMADGASSFGDRVLHVKFRDLVQEPLGCVAAIYERFGLSFGQDLTTRIRDFTAERPNGGYGRRSERRLQEYGLDEETERLRHQRYISCFGV